MMKFIKNLVPQSVKNIWHMAQAAAANFLYGFPSQSIKVIGVTGTNGKTTTVQMIAKILEEAGHQVALASTINFKIGEKEWVNKTKFTTLSAFQVQKFILDAVKAKCEYLVLETSSHSLDQYRVWGVKYQTAVITNVTREHLDYHQTMEEYRRAKMKLFEKAKIAIVNLDMERPEEFLRFNNEKKIEYTMRQNNELGIMNNGTMEMVRAENINIGNTESRFIIHNSLFIIHLVGRFNVENALAAVCAGLAENISLETCAKALEKIQGIPGRLEYVPNDKGLQIIIDYAVTPDSLGKLYALVNKIKIPSALLYKGGELKVIAIFGACGERDRGKRPLMGEIVARYADYIILTNEDPYGEEPMGIIKEIESGIKNKELSKNYWKILDRRAAIKKALQIAKPGDYIVVTGKGAEETMAIGDERIEWNDKKVIQEILQESK